MKMSARRRVDASALQPILPQVDRICFSILLQFPFPSRGAVSQEAVAAAVRQLGFVPEGQRFAVAIVAGSVHDMIDAAAVRLVRERDEGALVLVQRLPPVIRPAATEPLGEVANG